MVAEDPEIARTADRILRGFRDIVLTLLRAGAFIEAVHQGIQLILGEASQP